MEKIDLFDQVKCTKSAKKVVVENEKKSFKTGIVFDNFGTPLPSVHILNLHTGNGGVTNEKGIYELEANPTDELNISHVGFKTVIKVSENIPSRLTLEESETLLDEIIITPKKESFTKWWIVIAIGGGVLFYRKINKHKKVTG